MPQVNAERTMTDEELVALCRVCELEMLDRNLARMGRIPTGLKVLCLDSDRMSPDADLVRLQELWTTKREELWPEARLFLVVKPGVVFLQLVPPQLT